MNLWKEMQECAGLFSLIALLKLLAEGSILCDSRTFCFFRSLRLRCFFVFHFREMDILGEHYPDSLHGLLHCNSGSKLEKSNIEKRKFHRFLLVPRRHVS